MLAKKIIGTSVVLGVLCAGVGFAATSAEARSGFIEKFTAKTYTGTVTSFDRDKLKIRTFDGKDIEVSTNKDTKFSEEVGEGDNVAIVTDGRGDKDKKAKKVKKEHKSRYGHDNRDDDHNDRDHDRGHRDGHEDGYNDGHDDGKKDDDNDDYRNGHDNEYNGGYDEGYNQGFEEGKNDYNKEHDRKDNNRR